jgi:hypothetical protein
MRSSWRLAPYTLSVLVSSSQKPNSVATRHSDCSTMAAVANCMSIEPWEQRRPVGGKAGIELLLGPSPQCIRQPARRHLNPVAAAI